MSKIADLYVRVSTDEQAEKGYSQRNQEELLRKYCSINNIQIRNVIYEDHSAKTFNRPQWKKLLANLKKNKNKTDLVLFLKWDRFSRNAGDAYQMISLLRKLGVEPQAIEQPLDLSVPENKMMLAFYLAAPEVENDRRALNTIHGQRRAMKEGRCVWMAPYGYTNKSTETGKKYIEADPKRAVQVLWAFEQIAKGAFSTESIYHMAKDRGLKMTKANFWIMIRNPLYCGKILVPKYKDEDAILVEGQHEGIVSEGLFYRVQEVLDGNKRTYRPKAQTVENFPLRGFFMCPKCGRKLTGSKCKGRHKYYFYYHCDATCKYRINSEEANQIFTDELNTYRPIPEIKKLYSAVLLEAYKNQTGGAASEKSKILAQIAEYEKKLSVARDLLITEKIDVQDYNMMKIANSTILKSLERQLAEVTGVKDDIEQLVNQGVDNLLRLGDNLKDSTLVEARDMIGLIFPENFTFRENKFQTARINEIVRCIYLVNKELQAKKNGTKDDFFALSRVVTSTGFKPVTF